jgi:hypothetical protein
MKEVFKKLFGLEPMSAEDREAFALLPAVLVMGALCFGAAVLLG